MTDHDRLAADRQLASELIVLAVQLTHAAGLLRTGWLDRAGRKDLADKMVGLAREVSPSDDELGGPGPAAE